MTYQPNYPYPPQPQPPRKRKRWPWVVAGVAGFLVVVSATIDTANDAASDVYASPESTQAAAPAEVTETQESGPVTLAFGESHTWRGGEVITVSAPSEHKETNQFLRAPSGKRYVAFDVTVRNSGDDEFQVMSTKLTVQHAGRVAQRNYMAGDTLPDLQLPPGGETTFTEVYEIGDEAGELRVSVQPNMFAADTVYFVGEF